MDKVKLFETVLGIHEKGAASLTAHERDLIDAETRDLLSAASRRQAMKAPEGFDSLLAQLKSSENADDAFEMVLNFLKDQEGGIPGKADVVEDEKETIDAPMGECPLGGPGGDKKEDKLEDELGASKPDMDGMGLGLGLGKKPMDLDKNPMDKLAPSADEKKDEKPDFLKDKKDLLARAAKMKAASDDEDEDDKPDFLKEKKDDDKDDEKKEDKKDDDKKEDKDDDEKKEAMALKSPRTAAKVKVRVTSSRNLLVSYDGKPIFHAVPNQEVKDNANELKRLANKVYGWVVYEGAKVAASKCGSKLLAGVDDDVSPPFDSALTPPETDPVTAEGEDVIKDAPESPSSVVTEEAEFDTQDVPDKVTAGADDDVQVVTEEDPDNTPSSVLEGNENVQEEALGSPSSDVRDEADVDYQHVESSYRELYAARAKKAIKKANEDFAAKFVRCMKIASKRMLLNHDENPFKAAAMDVFTDDSLFDMYEEDAQELTEMIASLGHETFVDLLLERTAGLMKKSDEYVNDIEADLAELSVKPVEVEKVSRVASSKPDQMRKAASEGNFSIDSKNMGTPVTRSLNNQHVGGVRGALGDTLLSRRSKSLQELGAQIER